MTFARLAALSAVLFIVGTLACSSVEKPPPLDPGLRAELEDWLDAHGMPPQEFVLDLFQDHDVVFLGEQHRIRHDVLFVQSLVAPLYGAGVRTLATEFGRRVDQGLIDSLLAAPEWNEELGRTIVRQQFSPWGFREYVDIYRAAWELNRSLPADAPPFRILGINNAPDFSVVRTQADRNDDAIKKKIWHGETEKDWAAVIIQAVDEGEKVLVYCGFHHAFTKYRQPIVRDGRFIRFDDSKRAGNYVYDALGERAVTIYLHAPWDGLEGYGYGFTYPADGVIDALMLGRKGGPRPIGFRLADSPFGKLAVQNAVYRHGYEDFRLGDLCDGWIYTKPVSKFEGVTPIKDWITEENLEAARSQVPNPAYRTFSVERFNKAVAKDARMWQRWARRMK